MPVRFEKFRVRRQRFRQAEVVEHRRMQELRQIADALQRRFGYAARLLERGVRARVRARASAARRRPPS